MYCIKTMTDYRALRTELLGRYNCNKNTLMTAKSNENTSLVKLGIMFYTHIYNKNFKETIQALKTYKEKTIVLIDEYMENENTSNIRVNHSQNIINGNSEKLRIT